MNLDTKKRIHCGMDSLIFYFEFTHLISFAGQLTILLAVFNS